MLAAGSDVGGRVRPLTRIPGSAVQARLQWWFPEPTGVSPGAVDLGLRAS